MNKLSRKELRKKGFTYQKIAELFGVSRQSIWKTLNKKQIKPKKQKRMVKFYSDGDSYSLFEDTKKARADGYKCTLSWVFGKRPSDLKMKVEYLL